MARGRMLNRKISMNGRVAELINRAGFEAGLVYTWMIAHLDRDGRHHGDPDVVRSMICPRLSGLTPEHVRTMLEEANDIGLIYWYEVDGEQYIEFPKFRENNKHMKYDREAPSEFPPASGQTPDKVRTKSPLKEVKGKERKGREVKLRRVKPSTALTRRKKDPIENAVEEVVTHYSLAFPGRRTKRGGQTWGRVRTRLKDGHTVTELKQAIDANAADEFYAKINKHELSFICQSEDRVNEFLGKWEQQQRGPPESSTARASREWVEGKEEETWETSPGQTTPLLLS